jgi:hypothetical protein
MKEERYQGLVPIEGLVEIPKKRTSKQVDARWLEEVSASNRPNIHDLNAPMPGISTFSYGSNQKMSKIPRDRWSNVRSKNQEILQARFAAYHM